ncbi:MAG TPA: limonene-1,2-epoxide hydrolase family protein [Acidimicrobiales bacterium]|nr:limonene-1,2-epoxide hydrolase family protein [Acidimicrobiales bacterium]
MPTPPVPAPLDVVTSFCAAWSTLDIDRIMGLLAEDAVYHNIPVDPVVGHEAIRATIVGFTAGWDSVAFDVRHAVADGAVVLTERVDRFVSAERTVSLPVMGTFEVSDGLITAWRDYFDLNQFMSQLSD